MGLTRSSSGLLVRDEFDSDTLANYQRAPSPSTWVIQNGRLKTTAAAMDCIYHKTAVGRCVTVRSYGTDNSIRGVWCGVTGIDYGAYLLGYWLQYYHNNGVGSGLYKRVAGSYVSLGTTLSGTNPTGTATNMIRLYTDGATVYAKAGGTTLGLMSAQADDSTYDDGYGGVGSNAIQQYEMLEVRTSHTITCTGMTTGHYLRVSDGTTAAEAQESSGTASVDAGAVLFPLASVQIRTASGGGGDLIAELDTGDYADMGGGDAFAYSGATGFYLPHILKPQYHPAFGGLIYG